MYRIAYVDAHPRAFNPKSKLRVGQGPLVRRDFSDCANSDVQDNDPTLVGGTVLIVLNENRSSRITVTLTRAKANTVYHFFLKCVRGLGDILTDAYGAATKTFDLQPADARNTFTFDMYPDGAPAGNKYQSVQIQLDWYAGGLPELSSRSAAYSAQMSASGKRHAETVLDAQALISARRALTSARSKAVGSKWPPIQREKFVCSSWVGSLMAARNSR
jgi:hypothetical protein